MGQNEEIVQLELFAKQLEFMKYNDRYVHFCGGIGSGKTFVGAVWMVKAILESHDNRALICARDFGQLRNATLVEFNAVLKIFGLIEGKHFTFNKSVFEYRFFNGTVIICTGMNNPDSALRGPSYGIVWADEAEFYEKDAWLKLKGRVRRNPGLIRITSSPNGFNHMYDEFELREDADKKVVRSTTYDNPTLPKEYVEDLKNSYSPKMFSQEVLAERVSLNQQSVYDEFDRAKHVRTGCAELLRPTDQLFAFLDYNINRYPAVYMFIRNNTVYCVGEEWLEFGGSRQMAQQIKSRWPNRHVIVVGDSQGNNKGDVAADYSNYEIFRQEGIITKTFLNPPVQQRIINANSRLYHHKVVIDPSCEKLIRDLEQVSYDDKGKILKTGNLDLTHISDAWSYGMWYFLPLVRQNTYTDNNLI